MTQEEYGYVLREKISKFLEKESDCGDFEVGFAVFVKEKEPTSTERVAVERRERKAIEDITWEMYCLGKKNDDLTNVNKLNELLDKLKGVFGLSDPENQKREQERVDQNKHIKLQEKITKAKKVLDKLEKNLEHVEDIDIEINVRSAGTIESHIFLRDVGIFGDKDYLLDFSSKSVIMDK